MSPELSKDERIRLKKLLLQRDGEDCGICGAHMGPDDRSIDHIILRSRGGSNEPSNLRLAHKKCNSTRKDEGHETDNGGTV